QLEVGSTDAPWDQNSGSFLQAPPQTRLFAFTNAEPGAPIPVNWAGQLQDTPSSGRPALSGWFVPTLTASGDGATAPTGQQACYVTMLFLDAPAPVTQDAPQPPGDSSFEQLCALVGAWIAASVQSGTNLPLGTVLDSQVSEAQLHAIVDQLSGGDPYPIPLAAIDAFMAGQTSVN